MTFLNRFVAADLFRVWLTELVQDGLTLLLRFIMTFLKWFVATDLFRVWLT